MLDHGIALDPAIQAAGGRFLVRTSKVAKTYEYGLNDRTVVIEFENLAKAMAAYDTPDYMASVARKSRVFQFWLHALSSPPDKNSKNV